MLLDDGRAIFNWRLDIIPRKDQRVQFPFLTDQPRLGCDLEVKQLDVTRTKARWHMEPPVLSQFLLDRDSEAGMWLEFVHWDFLCSSDGIFILRWSEWYFLQQENNWRLRGAWSDDRVTEQVQILFMATDICLFGDSDASWLFLFETTLIQCTPTFTVLSEWKLRVPVFFPDQRQMES